MFRKVIFWVSFVVVVSFVSNVLGQAELFSVPTFQDITIDNGPRYGQTAGANGTGIEARDIATRRHVFLVSYDISELKAQGQFFSDVSFSLYSFNLNDETNVYGVIEPLDLLDVESLTWATAPGVKNDPLPVLDTSVVQNLDMNDLTDVLATFSGPGAAGERFSTDTSEALADFINSDTDGILTFLFAPAAEGNQLIVRSRELAEGGTFLEGLVGGSPTTANTSEPEHESEDVYRDQILSWKRGSFAFTHDIYLGTDYNDVNDADRENPLGVLVFQDYGSSSFDPGRLTLGQTYYWKINEVNGAPDFTIYPGQVWSFTVEPECYPIDGNSITTTASSQNADAFAPENTSNGAGLIGDQHSSTIGMWLSALMDGAPFLQYEFDKAYKLAQMEVWNYNLTTESSIGWGAKDVVVEYSLDGATWMAIDGITQFTQAPGVEGVGPTDTFDLGNVAAKYVRISISSNWGGLLQQYGLSEVRFCAIPTAARNPIPASGDMADRSSLSWRPGREAAEHEVYVGTDQNAVADGSAQSKTTGDNSVSTSSLGLILGQTFFWKVNEVNDAEDPSMWEGDVWNFTLPEFRVVDDFESYTNNSPRRPFQTWTDGLGYSEDEFLPANPGNSTGSAVGHDIWSPGSPFFDLLIMEVNDVHSGAQSMPVYFEGAGSQVDRALPGEDWTAVGIQTLVIYFFGSEGTTGDMYVMINNAKVPYDGDAADIATEAWTQWNIDLSKVNTDLTTVTNLSVGFDGNASGLVLLDDFRLYATAPEN